MDKLTIDEQRNVAWIIKHRPEHVEDVVGNEAKVVKKFLDSNNHTHFLFESRTPGTGKSTLAKAIIKDMGADYTEINSSKDRGIDVVREQIMFFVQTMSSKPGVKKIVFMDEFDGMSPISQQALREVMETYMHNAIFILTCNYADKIIDPIKNRCQVITFGNPDKKEVSTYLEKICKIEDLAYDEEGMNKLININYPSIRKMVGELQKFKALGQEVNSKNVMKLEEKYQRLWDMLKRGDAIQVRKEIVAEAISPELFLNHMFRQSMEDTSLTIKQVIALSSVLGELAYRFSTGTDKTIALVTNIFQIYGAIVKK